MAGWQSHIPYISTEYVQSTMGRALMEEFAFFIYDYCTSADPESSLASPDVPLMGLSYSVRGA